MKKIIIFNGPPGCGKDFAAEAIQNYLGDETVAHMKFGAPLKEFASIICDKPCNELEKSKGSPVFQGASYRDLQIALFNDVARSLGQDWLGQIATNKVLKEESDYIVFSDGGRPQDIAPLFRRVTNAQIMIVQIMRDGCSFSNDIRMYLSDNRAVMRHLVNGGSSHFKSQAIDLATDFFGESE